MRQMSMVVALMTFTTAYAAAQSPANATTRVDCAAVRAASADHATMDHAAHMAALRECAAGPLPTSAGQAAFGAIGEVVRLLSADPNTDWAKVNVEALRQHLIDMDLVTMTSSVRQTNVAGGMQLEVTGTGRTVGAIRRMAINHTRMLDQGSEYRASATEIANGARLVVRAKDVNDGKAVARLRGLGFAGLMTEGDHHAPHHLAIARGESVHRMGASR
jgi:hypothetical protein